MDKIEVHHNGSIYHVDREAAKKAGGWIYLGSDPTLYKICPLLNSEVWLVIGEKDPPIHPTAVFYGQKSNG